MANTRELSQLASVISVADETRNIGIGTTTPTSKLHVSGDVRVSGVITATAFVGDGSALTGLASIDSGILIEDDGTPVGIAVTIDFGTNLSVSFASGIATITGSTSQWVTTSAGIHTLSNVGIATTNPTSKLHVVGDVRVSGVVTATDFNCTSDINLKENIKPIEDSLNKIIQLNGIEFDWKCNQQPSIGVIAQEVEKVFPSLVKTAENKSVNYNGLVGVLIEAVKEQQKQIEELKDFVKNLTSTQ